MFNTVALAFAMPLHRAIGVASVIIAFWAAGGVAATAQPASPASSAMANDAGFADGVFGTSRNSDADALYFTVRPNQQQNRLFGKIVVQPSSQTAVNSNGQ